MVEKKRVLMICLGNICRSPIAHAVFDYYINQMNLIDYWEVDSAALIAYHTNKSPDSRAMSMLAQHGITNYSHRARPIKTEDFYNFDWIFGMDNANIEALNRLKPKDCKAKIELLGTYDPEGKTIIRDPYYDSGSEGFKNVYNQCTRAISNFLKQHKDTSK